MKKYLLIFAVALIVFGCSNESEIEQPKQEVEVLLDYSFVESGSMSRAGSDAYTNFYNKYIKTKLLTPASYSLSFKNKETGSIATIDGLWKNKEGIKLLEGEYEVTGISHPSGNSLFKESISDTVYLNFKENININSNTDIITLTAIYDSYMLLFDVSNTSSVIYKNDSSLNDRFILSKDNEIIYAFMHSFYSSTIGNKIYISRKDGKISTIILDKIPFEKGKYYYFNDITNSFDIPPMTEGN